MKLLFDFFPIFLFFIAFKVFDHNIYIATATTMAASLLQVLVYWLKHRKFEMLHLITLVIVVLLGSITLLLHNDLFIKWKPTAIYWLFAFVFFISSYISKKPLIQRVLDSQMSLPDAIWRRLNFSWVVFFTVMGAVNIYIVYHFSTNTWVNFKLFGTLALTVLFIIAQAFYMSKFIAEHTVAHKAIPNPKRRTDDL